MRSRDSRSAHISPPLLNRNRELLNRYMGKFKKVNSIFGRQLSAIYQHVVTICCNITLPLPKNCRILPQDPSGKDRFRRHLKSISYDIKLKRVVLITKPYLSSSRKEAQRTNTFFFPFSKSQSLKFVFLILCFCLYVLVRRAREHNGTFHVIFSWLVKISTEGHFQNSVILPKMTLFVSIPLSPLYFYFIIPGKP